MSLQAANSAFMNYIKLLKYLSVDHFSVNVLFVFSQLTAHNFPVIQLLFFSYYASFRDGSLLAGWDVLWLTLTYAPDLKFLASPNTDIQKVLQMHKIGWFGVAWSPNDLRSLAMSPLHRMHMTSYSSVIQTMHLWCTVFEI